jgi:hypothetical protein
MLDNQAFFCGGYGIIYCHYKDKSILREEIITNEKSKTPKI